ncbi:MAG: hypothetical protein U0746_00595 [Gemmataceae bacterium]
MNGHSRRTLGTALVLVTMIVGGVAADSKSGWWKPVLLDNEFSTLVTADAKTIGDTLAKGKPDKKGVAKARAAALMVAAYAQGAMAKDGAKAPELSALRDNAVAVAQAIKDDKFDEAKKIAADIKVAGKGGSSAKPDAVAVEKQFDLKELMSQFKPDAAGGISLERNLTKFWNKRGTAPFKEAELKEVLPLLLRTAVIAQVTEAMAPTADEGKKTREAWVKWSKEMGELAEEAAKQARQAKPDDKVLKSALKKLEGNCAACHAVFRTE